MLFLSKQMELAKKLLKITECGTREIEAEGGNDPDIRINVERVRKMNFEQWMKEMSKDSSFPGDEENSVTLDKIESVKYWDVEDEEEFQKVRLEKS